MMDAAEGKQRETETLSRALLSLNFAAIHTTSSVRPDSAMSPLPSSDGMADLHQLIV